MKLPVIDYLVVCSGISLHEFELKRRNEAANLRKQLIELFDALTELEVEARFARALIEYQRSRTAVPVQTSFGFHAELAALPAPPHRITNPKERYRYGSQSRSRRRNQKERIAG